MSKIDSNILLVVANGVEPLDQGMGEWVVHNCPVSGEFVALDDLSIGYNPLDKSDEHKAQQLRIRDFLAEKGVVIYFDASRYNAARLMPDGTLEHVVRACGDPLYTILAHHKNINACAVLAAHAVIKGEG